MKKTIYTIYTMLCIVFALKSFGQCIPSILNQPTSNQGLCNAQFGAVATNGIGCNCGYFSEVLTQTLCVTPGVSYTLNASATTQFGGSAAMWFDANQDNLFSLSELVFNGQASTQYSFSLPANIAAGQYKVRVITNGSSGINSSNSCGSYYDGQDFEFTISHSVPNNISISSSSALPCLNATRTLSVVNTGTTAITGYNWGWTTANNIVGTNTLSTINLTNAYAGVNYVNNVEVTYGNGCKNTASFSYSVNPEASSYVLSASGNASLCANTVNTLAYNTSFLYGTMVSHLWSTGSTANTSTVLVGSSPISASVTVTRNDGCVFTFTGTIGTSTTTPPIPTLNLSPSATVCANSTITATFGGTTSYLVNWGDGNYVSSHTTVSGFTFANPYIYHPTFSDTVINIIYKKGGFTCLGQLTRTITVLASPTVAVSSGTICAGKSFTISPSGATTYGYSGGSAIVAPTASLNTYTVTGYTGSCSDTETLTVAVIANPTITVSGGAICSGKSFTINPTGATNYTYSSGSAIVSPIVNTTYSVTGSNGTCSQTKTLSVTVNATPTVSASNGSICNGTSFNLSPTGATTYTISGGNATVNPSVTTSYTINGTSSQGCISSTPFIATVVVNTTPTITASNGTICVGESFTINPSGATTYTYSGGSAVVAPTTNTTYVITGSNGSCSSTKNVTVTVNAKPTTYLNISPSTTLNACPNEVMTFSPMSYNNYAFTFNGVPATVNANFDFTLQVTQSQPYTFVATNTVTGCTRTSPFTVKVLTNTITITSTAPTNLCLGQSAVLTASVTGEQAYFAWSNASVASTTTMVTPTVTTTYTYTAPWGLNGNVCEYSATFTQSVSVCTGIDEATNNHLISMYPNPAQTVINVELLVFSERADLKIINALGEEVLSELVYTQNSKLNIENLNSGVYYIKVESKQGTTTKKFIKE